MDFAKAFDSTHCRLLYKLQWYILYIGGVFNLAVWQIIYISPNLNNRSIAIIFTNSYSLLPYKSDANHDWFAKYLTCQLFCVYGI